MNFTSLPFFLVLFPVVLIFYALPTRLRAYFLLLACLSFYGFLQPNYLILLIASSGLIFGCGLKIASTTNDRIKQLFLAIGVVTVISLIIIFKTLGAWHGILLPLGISYYSFKLLGYLIEVYWDEESIEHNFVYFLTFTSFFPQIVSGPIQRSYDFLEQIRVSIKSPANTALITEGFGLILSGLMMKLLVGDPLDVFINTTNNHLADYDYNIIFTTILCYTLQLYADFSGYTNIALGIGKLFGITGPANFNAPFAAPNIQIMWQRWHISLTSWLTDYLFIPLNISLRKWGQFGLALAVTLDLVIIGLWHGFKVNYLVYGLLHGACINLTLFTAGIRDRIFGSSSFANRLRYFLGVIVTFVVVGLIEIVFRTTNWHEAVSHFELLFKLAPAGSDTLLSISRTTRELIYPCMLISLYAGLGQPGFKYIWKPINAYIPNYIQYGLALLLISALSTGLGSEFLYGQF